MEGISSNKLATFKYTIVDFIVTRIDTKTSELVKAQFKGEVYIVNDLKTNILISTNIIEPKKFRINLRGKEV